MTLHFGYNLAGQQVASHYLNKTGKKEK